MRIEENEKGELCWATDYKQDVLYINSLKDENVISLFMTIFEEGNKGDLEMHNLCNSELDPVVNPIRKSCLLRKSEACVSNNVDKSNQCLDKVEPNNQFVLIKDNGTDSVAYPIRKSDRLVNVASLAEVIDNHEQYLPKNVHVKGKEDPYKGIQDQCFITATRSRSKEASEKVPDIFPLQGEHRKPEHVHKPRKDRILNQPVLMQHRDNVPQMVQPPPQIPQNININQDIGLNQTPAQRHREVIKTKVDERNKGSVPVIRAFQLPKTEIANNIGQAMPNLTQQPVMDFYPRQIRNVPQDPITQHTDQRAKPKIYESLIRPIL